MGYKHILSWKHVQVPFKIFLQMHPPMLFDWTRITPESLNSFTAFQVNEKPNKRSSIAASKTKVKDVKDEGHYLSDWAQLPLPWPSVWLGLEDGFERPKLVSQHSPAVRKCDWKWLTPKNASSNNSQLCCVPSSLFCCTKMSGIGW